MGGVRVKLQNGEQIENEYESLSDIHFHDDYQNYFCEHNPDEVDYDDFENSDYSDKIEEITLIEFNIGGNFNNLNELLKSFRFNLIIKKFAIEYGSITDEAIVDLAKFLRSHQTIETLTINNLFNKNQDVSSLIEAIAESQSLTAVDFSNNNFYTNITAAIAKALHNKPLKSLNLSGNFIGEEAAVYIVELLNNGTLTELNLNRCNLSDNSVKLLAEALKNNQTLRTLSMAKSTVATDEAIKSLEDVITNNTGLISLNIVDSCDQQGRVLLTTALKNNYTLIKFEIAYSYYQIGDQYTISAQSADYEYCEGEINKVVTRNKRLLSHLADGLIALTQNQSMLHAFSETYKYVMRDYLIEHKNLTLEQADEVIAAANKNYNLIDALFKYGLIAKEINLPDDKLYEIAKLALPQGHRAMVEAQSRAQAQELAI